MVKTSHKNIQRRIRGQGVYKQNQAKLEFIPNLIFWSIVIFAFSFFLIYFQILGFAFTSNYPNSQPYSLLPEEILSRSSPGSILNNPITSLQQIPEQERTKLKSDQTTCDFVFSKNVEFETNYSNLTLGFWIPQNNCKTQIKALQLIRISMADLVKFQVQKSNLTKIYNNIYVWQLGIDNTQTGFEINEEVAQELLKPKTVAAQINLQDFIYTPFGDFYLKGSCETPIQEECFLISQNFKNSKTSINQNLWKSFGDITLPSKLTIKFAFNQDSLPNSVSLVIFNPENLDSLILIRVNPQNSQVVQKIYLEKQRDSELILKYLP